jgi:hypothetical protein
MARYRFGEGLTSFGIEPPSSTGNDVQSLPDATGTLWDDSSGGNQYFDLLDSDESTPREDVETDSDGFLVPFYAPDEVFFAWLDFGSGRRFLIISLGYLTQLNLLLNTQYLGYVDVSTGLEDRPAGLSRVIWIGGSSQPVQMNTGDVWLSELVMGS